MTRANDGRRCAICDTILKTHQATCCSRECHNVQSSFHSREQLIDLDAIYWTKERIIAALKREARSKGRSPIANEWKVATGQLSGPKVVGAPPGNRATRPSGSHVARVFGTWNLALEAAGLPVREPNTKKKARCSRGHLFTLENTYVYPNGVRQCRRCHRSNTRRVRVEVGIYRMPSGNYAAQYYDGERKRLKVVTRLADARRIRKLKERK